MNLDAINAVGTVFALSPVDMDPADKAISAVLAASVAGPAGALVPLIVAQQATQRAAKPPGAAAPGPVAAPPAPPDGILMPGLVGQQLADAQQRLRDSKLQRIRVHRISRGDVPVNQITAQMPAQNEPVLYSETVVLTVSAGPPPNPPPEPPSLEQVHVDVEQLREQVRQLQEDARAASEQLRAFLEAKFGELEARKR